MANSKPHTSKSKVIVSPTKTSTMAGDANANENQNPPAGANGNPLPGGLDLSALIQAIKENTSARSNAGAAPKVSTSLTLFNKFYLGQHGHSKQSQQQFLKATSCPEGEKPLDMVRSNSDGIIRRLKSSLRLGHFDGPANQFYTEGTGTVHAQPDRVGSIDVANIEGVILCPPPLKMATQPSFAEFPSS